MASSKDTFESKTFASNTFACGTWRGSATGPVDKVIEGFILRDNRSHYTLGDNKSHYTLKDNRSHYGGS